MPAAVAQVHHCFDHIDILLNSIDLGSEHPAESVREENFDLTFDVNVKGACFFTQAVGWFMIARGQGRIISMSSQAGCVVLQREPRTA